MAIVSASAVQRDASASEYPFRCLPNPSVVPKIFDIFEGTEQIQQPVIARVISGLRIE